MKHLKNFESYIKLNETIEHKMLYHGSNYNFNEFDIDKISTGDGSDLFGKGFYLTNNIKVAEFYAKLITKKEKIKKYTNTGIFGSEEPVYSDDADDYAQQNYKINKFKIDGNILNVKTYIIDEKFSNFIRESHKKHSGWGDAAYKIYDSVFNHLKSNKQNVQKFRGELLYIIQQIVLSDKDIMNDIINYIKNIGFDGLKYESDKDFEGENSWNYVIYNKNIITKID